MKVDTDSLPAITSIDGKLSNKINEYILSRGIASTTLTSAILRAHFIKLYAVIAGFFVLQRTQDLQNLKDIDGMTVSTPLFYVPITDPDPEDLFAVYTAPLTAQFSDSITNNAWNDDVVGPISGVLSTPNLMQTFAEIFLTLHIGANSNDENLIDVIWPQVASYSGWKTLLAALRLEYATYPDLVPFMRTLGFKSLEEMGTPLVRDRFKSTVRINSSGLAELIFANCNWFVSVKRDSEATATDIVLNNISDNEFLFPNSSRTILDPDHIGFHDQAKIPKATFMLAKMFGGTVQFEGFVRAYVNAGILLSQGIEPIWALPWQVDNADVINTGGGAGTGLLDLDWIGNHATCERSMVTAFPPSEAMPLIVVGKDVNSISGTPEIVYINNLFSSTQPGLGINKLTVENGEYYSQLVQLLLLFAVTDTADVPW